MPSKLSWFLQSAAVASGTTVAAFFVYTKHCHFTPEAELLGGRNRDSLWTGTWFQKLNPERNQVLFDECVRKVPLWKVRRDLVEDAERGGGKLVEDFTGGIWGGFGYTIQRKYLETKYRNDTTTAHQLWDKKELLNSKYDQGTEITDHFAVLSKSPTTVLIRCGDSPLNSPGEPRPSDGLFEITAKADLEKGFAEFRLKCLFFQGVGKSEEKPLSGKLGIEDWLHKQYTKLLMETAVGRCMNRYDLDKKILNFVCVDSKAPTMKRYRRAGIFEELDTGLVTNLWLNQQGNNKAYRTLMVFMTGINKSISWSMTVDSYDEWS